MVAMPFDQILFNQADRKKLRQHLRQEMPKAEVILWSYLQKKQLAGFKFRRQHGIGNYVVDFYCPKVQLVIELDGDTHYTPEAEQYDQQRDEFLRAFGLSVLRFTNQEIYQDLESVLDKIKETIRKGATPS